MEHRLFTPAFARVWLATLGVFMTFGMLVVALPLYLKDDLGRGSAGVGLAMSAASLTAIPGSILAGRLADRRGRRMLLAAGSLTMAICYFALALGPGFEAVIAIRLLAGAGEAAFIVGLYTVATDLSPENRHGEAISLVTLASYLGLTFGPAIGELIRGDGRYELVWLVAAGVTLASVAGVIRLPETKPELEAAAPAGWLPPRGAIGPGLLVLVGLLGMGGFISFGAIYARDLGIGRPGLALALFGGVVSAVRLFGRRIPDRFGARRTLVFSFVTLAVGLATIGLWQSPLGLFAGTFVLAVGQALTYPSAILLAIEATSASERAAAVGSVGAFVDVALGLGALVVGSIAAGAGYGTAFLAVSGVALCGLLVLAPMRRSPEIALESASK